MRIWAKRVPVAAACIAVACGGVAVACSGVDEAQRSGKTKLEDAVREALSRVRGAYAIAVVTGDSPEEIVVAKQDSPIVLGLGDGETFLSDEVRSLDAASDAQADAAARAGTFGFDALTLVLVGDRAKVLPQLAEAGLPAPDPVDAEGRPVR